MRIKDLKNISDKIALARGKLPEKRQASAITLRLFEKSLIGVLHEIAISQSSVGSLCQFRLEIMVQHQ